MGEYAQVSNFDGPSDGYIIIAPLSAASRAALESLQDQMAAKLPADSLWLPRGEQLHITFAHIISPETEHPDRPALYRKLGPQVLEILGRMVPTDLDIALELAAVEAFPAAIIAKWRDDGTYARLRERLMQEFTPPQGSRLPPQIIHTTLARFRQEVPMQAVQDAVAALQLPAPAAPHEHTTQLQVIHERKIFVQEHDIVATFPR